MPSLRSFFDRAARKAVREWIRRSSDPRPASYPFISGDGFRAMSDHVLDDISSIDPLSVKGGDVVFVQSDLVERFFAELHPRIKARYILVTHNSDKPLTEERLALMDDKVIHWFSFNMAVRHPKVTALPLGLENAHYVQAGMPRLYRKPVAEPRRRNGRILVAFNTRTNPPARERILASLKRNPLADVIEWVPDQRSYLRLLDRYAFVASPPGSGIDCHRTWESMYRGAVPIIEPSVAMEPFITAGLPLIAAEAWDAVGAKAVPGNAEHPALSFAYWREMILSKKRES